MRYKNVQPFERIKYVTLKNILKKLATLKVVLLDF